MILVDTSIWIAVFAKHRPLPLEKVLDFEEVSTCLPVVLIAACPLSHDRYVLHRDRDYQLLSAVSGLKCRAA